MVLDRVGKLAGVAKLGWWVIGWCSGGLASLLGRLQHSRRCPRSYLATFVGLTLNTSSFVHFLGAFVVRSWGQHVVRDNKVQGIATSFGPALIGLWALPVYIYIYIYCFNRAYKKNSKGHGPGPLAVYDFSEFHQFEFRKLKENLKETNENY
jgi:hypothetical protein